MLSYYLYKLGDIVYTAQTSEGQWKLIDGIRFRKNIELSKNKKKLDEYFGNLRPCLCPTGKPLNVINQ